MISPVRKPYRSKTIATHKERHRHENRSCLLCGNHLKQISTDNRNLITLERKSYLSIQICRCVNPTCPNHKTRLKPPSYLQRIVPESGYGIDVYALVGHLRLSKRHTVPEIHEHLTQHYTHVEIGERHVENLVNLVNLCLAESGQNASYLRQYFSNRSQSILQLAIDGIQPEQGHSILYVVREVMSGKILYAYYSAYGDTNYLVKHLFKPLKGTLDAAGLTVGGWIADKELALGKGIGMVYPDVPFQHCQSHFLAAMKKPLTEADTALGKTVKKKFGKLRPVEREVEQLDENPLINPTQIYVLKTTCCLLRSWLSTQLAHKHRFKGVELYEVFAKIDRFLISLDSEHTQVQEICQTLSEACKASLEDLETPYQALKYGQNTLNQLSDLLYGTKDDKGKRNTQQYKENENINAQQVQKKVEALLEQSTQAYKQHSPQMREYLRHFHKTYQDWKIHLFTCYDHPDISNDNNRLELSHSQSKKHRRRVTGQKSTAQYIKKHGEQVMFCLYYTKYENSPKELEELLRQCDFEHIKEKKKEIQQKNAHRAKLVTTLKTVEKTIEDLTKIWQKETQ